MAFLFSYVCAWYSYDESEKKKKSYFLSFLQSISSVYTGLMQGVGAAEKVFEYIDRKPKHILDGQEAPETFGGQVEFRNVTFAYPTRSEMDILKVFFTESRL